ncbi:Mucin-5B [Xylographa carneopallida]|nr:Mucin-5B [Xylographa carneopallida]
MKSSFAAAIVLLAATPVFTSPIAAGPVNGVLPGPPSLVKRVEVDYPVIEARATQTCNADNVLRDLRNPTVSIAASSFCSAYLQKTSTVTVTTVVPQTSVVAVTDTTLVTQTTTEVSTVVASTILCAAPSSTGTTCNYPGYGYASDLISSTPNTDPVTCHEQCLADPTCQSFQVETVGAQYCNLFNLPTAGNVQYAPNDVFTFFDRDCPQYLPPACGATSAPARKAKRTVPVPTYIPATVPASRISSACSCFITAPSAAATATVVVPQTSVTTATTTAIVTATTEAVVVVTTTVVAVVTAAP